MNLDNFKNIHFVGIGGIGMSGLAEILKEAGLRVSGCDARKSAVTDLLTERGIDVLLDHDPAHLDGVDLVVMTAAVKGENAEVDAARQRGIRIMRRAELLGQIVNARRGIGVAGTHGKTTTSAMIATILEESGYDPTVLIGGILRNLGTNAKTGKGEFLVVEADEYDRTFHLLHPEVAVVTNIEADHLEYYGSFTAILEAFEIFLRGIPKDGVIIGCSDDKHVATLLDRLDAARAAGAPVARIIRYGLGEEAGVRATNLQFRERGSTFDVPDFGFFKLFVPGDHNVRNALGAIIAAREIGVSYAAVSGALAKFLGVDRRFQILGDYIGALIVDDYAHHPTEIRATLEAARKGYPGRRIVALFQPHLYSRTRDFAADFNAALRLADVALVSPIYAAREKPLEGVSARMIADAGAGVEFIDRSNAGIFDELRRRLLPSDVFIAMGAGDVHEVAEMLVRGEDTGGPR